MGLVADPGAGTVPGMEWKKYNTSGLTATEAGLYQLDIETTTRDLREHANTARTFPAIIASMLEQPSPRNAADLQMRLDSARREVERYTRRLDSLGRIPDPDDRDPLDHFQILVDRCADAFEAGVEFEGLVMHPAVYLASLRFVDRDMTRPVLYMGTGEAVYLRRSMDLDYDETALANHSWSWVSKVWVPPRSCPSTGPACALYESLREKGHSRVDSMHAVRETLDESHRLSVPRPRPTDPSRTPGR